MRLRDLPVTLNPGAVSLSEGLRAGIAVAATLLVGQVFALPHFGLAALGALLTCFADPGGPFWRRAQAVVAFALFSGIVFGLFGFIRGEGVALACAAALVMIFAASYARVYGQGGLQVGNLLSVVTVLALDVPVHGVAQAAAQGLNFCAGAAWAALLTLVIWRVHPFAPSRLALAAIAARLAALTGDLAALATEAEDVAAFEAHAALHRRQVRETIEAARQIAYEIFRGRGLASARAAQVTLRLQSFEQIFGGLIALSDTLESEPALRMACGRPLRHLAEWLAAAGPRIAQRQPTEIAEAQASLAQFRHSLNDTPQTSAARHLFDAIAENLAVLITVATPQGQRLSATARGPGILRQITGPPVQNFTLSAAPLRHALRAALTATPVLAWTMAYGGPFAHWATITLILCLQPYFSATWVRSAERIAGTAFGGILAAGIGLLAQTRLDLALAMLPLTMFAFTIRAVSYGLFIAALTPMIVLLVEQIAPGANELTIALSRVGYTCLGGGLAVLANLLLWPAFEGGRLEASITAAINAHAAYTGAVFAALLGQETALDATRRHAGLASNNLEAALSRALLEPHKRRDKLLERGALADAALRRMAGRLSVLALDRPDIPPEDADLWRAWGTWLADRLAGNRIARPPLPQGASTEALTRLARQAELIHPG
ncbi:MAG: FUSC family protein [Acidocella sp.]|nr:FUSC family protein [Acidocella sp.]